MARIDAIREKIQKLGRKQKLDALIKYSGDNDETIRTEAAIAMGMISTYEAGMALIPLLRDSSPMVRAAAATSAADIHAKHCEEYVKKLAFADSDPNVRNVAKAAFDRLKTSVV
ncbi:MAG: HEAT repeat domain-containing protein [Clostridiales bacterium]|nr:HEAT repeat domain-containing protein [Clostridiales bacterium]